MTTSMYIATLSDTKVVIDKFTACYNKVAHHLLTDANLAPKLHFCKHVIEDLYMVVMDRVNGASIWQLQEDKKLLPAIVLKNIDDAALHILHAKDIVFVDWQDPNILYLALKTFCYIVVERVATK
jgi:hypothetical protein